jgi:hypothetical protein
MLVAAVVVVKQVRLVVVEAAALAGITMAQVRQEQPIVVVELVDLAITMLLVQMVDLAL